MVFILYKNQEFFPQAKTFSKGLKMEQSLSNYATIISAETNHSHILPTQRKMPKFIQTTAKFSSFSKLTLSGITLSFYSHSNSLFLSVNHLPYGIYSGGCLSCLTIKRKLLIEVLAKIIMNC